MCIRDRCTLAVLRLAFILLILPFHDSQFRVVFRPTFNCHHAPAVFYCGTLNLPFLMTLMIIIIIAARCVILKWVLYNFWVWSISVHIEFLCCYSVKSRCCAGAELRLMFSLMDRVERGIDEMLRYLEEHIKHQGLADMIVSANIITTVR